MITLINQTNQSEWEQYEQRFQELFKKTMDICHIDKDYAVSVILVDAKQIHEINRDYRHIDRPTDVISFAMKDSEDELLLDELDLELGDVFINVEAVVSQAQEYQHTPLREISFLCTHGLLHLLGYDHMTSEDEAVMFQLQDVILDGFDF